MFILCISCITATPHISPTRAVLFIPSMGIISFSNARTYLLWTLLPLSHGHFYSSVNCDMIFLWWQHCCCHLLFHRDLWHLYDGDFSTLAVITGGVSLCMWWFYARRLYGRTFYNDCGARNALLVHLCGNTPRFFWWWQQGPSMLRESDSCKMSPVAFLHASSCHDRQFYISISALNPAEAIFVVCLFAISPVACRLFFFPRCEERSEPEW